MHWRIKELSWLTSTIEWLLPEEALRHFAHVAPLLNSIHYGFDPSAVSSFERTSSGVDITAWLHERLALSERVIVVFGRAAVCRLPKSAFIEQWPNIFCPSRDDAVILDESFQWALFYCHEDEFEFARIKA